MGLGRMVLLFALLESNIAQAQQVAIETATRDPANQSREASEEEYRRFLGIWQLIASEGLRNGQTEERIEVKEGDVYWVKEGGVLEHYRQKPYSSEGPRSNPYEMPKFKLMECSTAQVFILRVEGAIPPAFVRTTKKGDEELLMCELPNAINARKKLGVRFVLRRLKEIPGHLIDRPGDSQ